MLSTEISPSNCCLSYCKKESDWLLNSQSIIKCFLGDFSVMRTQAGYSKKHDNILLVVFGSYTFNLAFESMTKMDEWYSALQAVTSKCVRDIEPWPSTETSKNSPYTISMVLDYLHQVVYQKCFKTKNVVTTSNLKPKCCPVLFTLVTWLQGV